MGRVRAGRRPRRRGGPPAPTGRPRPDRQAEASVWNSLSLALRHAGRAQEAADAITRARDLFHATGDGNREAQAWNNLGNALDRAGCVQEAIDAYTRALELHEENDHVYAIGQTPHNLAGAYRSSGDPIAARFHFALAAEAYTHAGAPAEAADARARADGRARDPQHRVIRRGNGAWYRPVH
ncbi:tetratricopeptide repeat protein [Streptomyces sp. NPDC012510]|uniref:tetratricopeptide repeat protein n=1 Tax=Streptomyces sp. NPDC012510 TaxID=3364838 RepID=UPI0036E53CF4